MDGPRDYHTEWNKSERKRQILYTWYHLCVGFKYDTGTSLVGYPPSSVREAGSASGWVTGIPHAMGQLSLLASTKIWRSQEWINKYMN